MYKVLTACLQEDANAAKSSLRVLVNVGKAEVELLRGTQERSSDSNSLARFMIGGLWVSYRMTYGGKSSAKQFFLGGCNDSFQVCQPMLGTC